MLVSNRVPIVVQQRATTKLTFHYRPRARRFSTRIARIPHFNVSLPALTTSDSKTPLATATPFGYTSADAVGIASLSPGCRLPREGVHGRSDFSDVDRRQLRAAPEVTWPQAVSAGADA